MKIIPHPALLREREEELKKAQSELAQRARELHVLEIMINSQYQSEKRQSVNRKIYQAGLFLLGFVVGFLFTIFIS